MAENEDISIIKKQILTKLDKYINNRIINIFSNHHHNERAINTRNYISQINNDIELIKSILDNERCLFEPESKRSSTYNIGFTDSNPTLNTYDSSRYANKLKNKNKETSTYFRIISECLDICERTP
jgi:hypothetical protein